MTLIFVGLVGLAQSWPKQQQLILHL